jgi:hypothetical protein
VWEEEYHDGLIAGLYNAKHNVPLHDPKTFPCRHPDGVDSPDLVHPDHSDLNGVVLTQQARHVGIINELAPIDRVIRRLVEIVARKVCLGNCCNAELHLADCQAYPGLKRRCPRCAHVIP